MNNVTNAALTKALTLLKAIKAEYKIIAPDGTEYGTLVVVPPKKPRSVPWGELANYYRPLVQDLKPGDMVLVPTKHYDMESLRGSMAGWFSEKWGKGSAITSVNRDDNVVEVLRVK